MIRNQAGTIKVFAFNRTNNAPVTGDAANITCQYDLDRVGLLALADATPDETELGFYVFNVTAAECDGTTVDFYPESSTSNVQVIVVEHDRYLTPNPTEITAPGSVTHDTADQINITRNDSYDGTANALKSFTVTKNYTGWTGTFTVRHRTTGASLCSASVTVASSTLLTVSLSSTATAFALLVDDTEFGPHPFDIEMVSGSSKQQAVSGVAIVRKDVTYA